MAKAGNKGARDWDDVFTTRKAQLITVGIAFCRSNVIDIHKEGAVTLKDIIVREVIFQGCQRRTKFGFLYLTFF